jgi:hypothetical protein
MAPVDSCAERLLAVYLEDIPPDEHERAREAVMRTLDYQQAVRADAGDIYARAYVRNVAQRLRRIAEALDPTAADT